MNLNRLRCWWLAVGSMLCVSVAAQTCLGVTDGKGLRFDGEAKDFLLPENTKQVAVYLPSGSAKPVGGESTAVKDHKKFVVDADFAGRVQKLISPLGADQRPKYRLAAVDETGTVQSPNGGYPFYLSSSESDPEKKKIACADGGPAMSAAAAPSLVTPSSCEALSESLKKGARYEEWVIFDAAGNVCYQPATLRQRDQLNFVMAWTSAQEVRNDVTALPGQCTKATAAPVVRDALEEKQVMARNVITAYRRLLSMICASDSPQVTLTIPAQGNASAKTVSHTFPLYERETAAIHTGVVFSKLRDPSYGLRTLNGQTTIVNEEASNRGPEYVAMVVVHALPRYFLSPVGFSYPGRDLTHDNEWQDRLGLAFSFGLQEPKRRLGVGLSYEIAKGINLVGLSEWMKRDRLSGVAEGDVFAGAATDIPKRKHWDRSFALGITFDTAYLAKIFGGGAK